MQQRFKLSLGMLNTILLIALVALAAPLPVSAAPLSQAGCTWYYPETLSVTKEANPYADIPFSDGAIYVPRHFKGDKDFSDNGPWFTADVLVNLSNRGLWMILGLTAIETKGDETTVTGKSDVLWFLRLRPEWKLRRVAQVKANYGKLAVIPESIITVVESKEGSYWFESLADEDKNHDVNTYYPKGRNAQAIQRIEIVGDTRGDEAGTRTSIRVYTPLWAYELCPRY